MDYHRLGLSDAVLCWLVCKNINIVNVPFGSIKHSCNNLLFCFELNLFWLDHGRSADHMTEIIHGSPEDGALTQSWSAAFYLISEINTDINLLSVTCEPWTRVVTAAMVAMGKPWLKPLYRSNVVLRALLLKAGWRVADVYSRVLESSVSSRDSKWKHHKSMPRGIFLPDRMSCDLEISPHLIYSLLVIFFFIIIKVLENNSLK